MKVQTRAVAVALALAVGAASAAPLPNPAANPALKPAVAAPAAPRARPVANPIARFAGLDKITGRIIAFDAKVGETVKFGTLLVEARACLTRPPSETPQTDAFVQIDELQPGAAAKRIFSGWMFAASPGLNGVEHPVYDVWLTDCVNPNAPKPAPAAAPAATPKGKPVKKTIPKKP
ncbi:MAG: DUF2155 domain-containing protein [Hyphomicrobiales bacterium]|nr:DUF2155 domain-containing protein [Hyphomicrobiales bacterium]MDE2017161.1 DUF2155 domain-containing protein [Hyphomicrobiales bacterium]